MAGLHAVCKPPGDIRGTCSFAIGQRAGLTIRSKHVSHASCRERPYENQAVDRGRDSVFGSDLPFGPGPGCFRLGAGDRAAGGGRSGPVQAGPSVRHPGIRSEHHGPQGGLHGAQAVRAAEKADQADPGTEFLPTIFDRVVHKPGGAVHPAAQGRLRPGPAGVRSAAGAGDGHFARGDEARVLSRRSERAGRAGESGPQLGPGAHCAVHEDPARLARAGGLRRDGGPGPQRLGLQGAAGPPAACRGQRP